ncbi:MAG: hydantoinase/oxoprolinase family protein [Candidatus Aminicenantes bacterium]|nr:hydantoinase/oxoprolinase family protein [Candidatus Aminicenantes bacterium]
MKRSQNKIVLRIGVDSGGTFTDVVIFDGHSLEVRKVPSTPQNPFAAVYEAIKDRLDGQRHLIIHGTTVGTNALLEKKGGKIALITTKGFEDVFFIGRQTRKELYRLSGQPPQPLLSPSLCFGLTERLLANGQVEIPINYEELEKIIKILKKEGVEAVAVSFLHSYRNPEHEQQVEQKLRQVGLKVITSSSLMPEYREYERTSTTVINAFLMPIMDGYLKQLEERLQGTNLKIMQSNEGYISASRARQEPIRTILSGPAGGVLGAWYLSKLSGFKNIISFDMGGTSTDVSLIRGQIKRSLENKIGDYTIRLPMVDVHSVGAGGGSIVYVDQGGLLRVGPQSVGAYPGPACYGNDWLPAVTDANLVLGRLAPDYFLGGRMKIYPERSYRALGKIARKIGRDIIETALGIIDIANASMEKAIRVISVERGYDTRYFSLVSFGGAGGLHAVQIAEHLKIPRVIVPRLAGVLSAFGLLMADAVKDYSRSFIQIAQKTRPEELENIFTEFEQKARQEMAAEGFADHKLRFERYLDLRYLGQSYELTIPYRPDPFNAYSYLIDFQKQHRRLFSYHHLNRPVEIVNLRLKVIAPAQKIKLEKSEPISAFPDQARLEEQWLYLKEGKVKATIYDREKLLAGNRVLGPALIIDHQSTTFLPPGYEALVDPYLNMIIEKVKDNG